MAIFNSYVKLPEGMSLSCFLSTGWFSSSGTMKTNQRVFVVYLEVQLKFEMERKTPLFYRITYPNENGGHFTHVKTYSSHTSALSPAQRWVWDDEKI